MNAGRLDDEIRDLQRRIEALKASKPAHNSTGTYERRLLELEEELDGKRKARREMKEGEAQP